MLALPPPTLPPSLALSPPLPSTTSLSPPFPPDYSTTSPHHETLTLELLCLNNPNVHHTLTTISKNYVVHGLIIDFFCVAAVAVARELNIPCYYFFTSGASYLDFFLYVPTLHYKFAKSFKDFDAPIDVPGTPPIPPSDVAKPMQDRYNEAYKGFLDSSLKVQTSAGIIVNTFEKLELRAIRAIVDGECVPDRPTPPLYCIGPLISSREGVPMLAWLLYAEQWHKRVLLVQEMRIALPVDELEDGRVSLEEVEKRVRELMVSEEGKKVRERALAMKEEATAGLSPGRSSLSA
ncbi:hypothetical protein NL676_001890 [Syzygium grande]|nr:hypothetical protein NL676_001890 [Syzygium grande]